MFETDAELWSALQQMSRTVNQVVAASKPIAKALDKMGDVASLNRQDYVADALNAIQHADLAPYGGADSYAALIRGLEDRLRTLRTTARQDLIAGLNATAPKPDQIKMVSDSPLVLYVHPLTLEVNFEQCKRRGRMLANQWRNRRSIRAIFGMFMGNCSTNSERLALIRNRSGKRLKPPTISFCSRMASPLASASISSMY